MLTFIREIHTQFGRAASVTLALLFFLAFSGSVSGQNASNLQVKANEPSAPKAASSVPQPVASIYKEVKIGTSADDVRELLGKAEIDDKDGFFYQMESEMVQIRLDENAKVRVISVTYSSDSPNVPKPADIFGDQTADVKPDGSVYRLVRYPEAGYWTAYSKTSGDRPTITVTMQKL
jgi:hypothetical protein